MSDEFERFETGTGSTMHIRKDQLVPERVLWFRTTMVGPPISEDFEKAIEVLFVGQREPVVLRIDPEDFKKRMGVS